MKPLSVLSVLVLLVFAVGLESRATAEDAVKADRDPNTNAKAILGKWELTEESAGMPVGTVFDFQKDGTLRVSIGERFVDFKFEVKGNILHLDILGQKDTTEIVKLTRTELICRDGTGVTGKFQKVKPQR